MQDLVANLLAALGDDPARQGLVDTPTRVETLELINVRSGLLRPSAAVGMACAGE